MGKLDAFYCDKQFARASRIRLPGYKLFSENMQELYPGFVLNKSNGLVENISNRDINLDQLLALLKSKDLSNYEKMKERFFTGQTLYTTCNAKEQFTMLLLTNPRSGNSMMRKYYENITGLATGSEVVMKY